MPVLKLIFISLNVTMRALKILLTFFYLRNFFNFSIVDGNLKKSKVLKFVNLIFPFIIVFVLILSYISTEFSDYVQMDGSFKTSSSLTFTLITTLISQPLGFIFISILNYNKRNSILKLMILCKELSKDFKLNLQRFGYECLIIFLILNFGFVFGAVSSLFNFNLSIRILFTIFLIYWTISIFSSIILFNIFFSKFVNNLLRKIDKENLKLDHDEVFSKLFQINDLMLSFQKAFGSQLTWSLCHIILSTIILVRKSSELCDDNF